MAALEELHAAAGYPSLRGMSKSIAEGDYPATASHESIRSVFIGQGKPRWETVQTIVMMLVDSCTSIRNPEVEIVRFIRLWRAAFGDAIGGDRAPDSVRGEEGAFIDEEEGDGWTAGKVAMLMMNPVNAIEIDPTLALPHEPIISAEDWVKVNQRLVAELGEERYLRKLLEILQGGYLCGDSSPYWGPFILDDDSIEIDEEFVHERISKMVISRLDSEPALLARAVAGRYAAEVRDPDRLADFESLEANPIFVREAMMASGDTWESISKSGRRLVFHYLIDEVYLGANCLPEEERVRVEWYIPESRVKLD
ncbi:hypothetical protein [Allokutzneria oryzae]|uniref:DUF4272 domain-containing protein n=1 Tax=Allokutzneria oryzae TaxID=1378989 RepID=A0ABV5ZZ79_9PSEU